MSARTDIQRTLRAQALHTSFPTRNKSNNATYSSDSKDSDSLPLLSRPLGVRDRPDIERQSRMDRFRQIYVDREGLIEERRHLVKEVTRSNFHDIQMLRHHGGKTWIAPKQLIREDKALYLPDISGKDLNGQTTHTTTLCFGKITVLSLISTKVSELQSTGFVMPTNERYAGNPLYQHLQINLQDSSMKSWIVTLFASSIKRTIDPNRHHLYIISKENMEYYREPLGRDTSKVVYVYLIDENLKIRWAAGADPLEEEVRALEICTGVLLNRWQNDPRREEVAKQLAAAQRQNATSPAAQ
ncbi:hypothetical protein FISHEDRAFT_74253 [Fistulina hepatica ATCC 64428]|uniref:F1F0 ATP synthase assembly protein Atp10 n=1 Tax=Fistulina hepatica ATCC 64428 TaxID=1128425 RepID=A0A0D7AB89_9AGAR|nr:hypothetical protein FISHEDRAFT_74253 [Fistulina hepatica ATCC 64428]